MCEIRNSSLFSAFFLKRVLKLLDSFPRWEWIGVDASSVRVVIKSELTARFTVTVVPHEKIDGQQRKTEVDEEKSPFDFE